MQHPCLKQRWWRNWPRTEKASAHRPWNDNSRLTRDMLLWPGMALLRLGRATVFIKYSPVYSETKHRTRHRVLGVKFQNQSIVPSQYEDLITTSTKRCRERTYSCSDWPSALPTRWRRPRAISSRENRWQSPTLRQYETSNVDEAKRIKKHFDE